MKLEKIYKIFGCINSKLISFEDFKFDEETQSYSALPKFYTKKQVYQDEIQYALQQIINLVQDEEEDNDMGYFFPNPFKEE